MTGIVSKFAISVFVAGAGGTAFGVPLSSSNKSDSQSVATLTPKSQDLQPSSVVAENYRLSLPQSTVDGGMVDTQDTSHLRVTETDLSSEYTLGVKVTTHKDSLHSQETTLKVDESEGNCTVIVTSENFQKIPTPSTPYVSLSCWNSVDGDSMLRLWKGLFPASLLKGDAIKLEQGTKFKLDVQEKVIPEDDDDTEPFEHVFMSEQFFKAPVTGRWGDTLVEGTEEDRIPIYVINLSKSGISDKFYILPVY